MRTGNGTLDLKVLDLHPDTLLSKSSLSCCLPESAE